MQDIRLRTGSAALLSVVAFSSVPGAAAVFSWWLLFARPWSLFSRIRSAYPVLILIGFFSAVLEITNSDGISYGFRMCVMVLIGIWLYSRFTPGEFIGLGTWLLGEKTGFELGMVAEMAIQALDLIISDFSRIRQAFDLKGCGWGTGSLVPAGSVLISGAISRAEETAELLAVKGYVLGGTYCPEFRTTRRDIIAGFTAVCIGIIAVLPASEFFIL